MKTRIILLALTGLLFFSGCSNDNETVETLKYPIEGLWIGTQTCDNDKIENSDNYYSLIVYEDGSILTKGKGADGRVYYASGTWTLSPDDNFTATITTLFFKGPPVTQVFTFHYSDSGVLTDGRWKDTVNGSQLGHFSTMKHVVVKSEKSEKKFLNSFLSQR
jgi:hypothetical protein